eukprot:13122939-Heterocapsa_arctica.AAC.1
MICRHRAAVPRLAPRQALARAFLGLRGGHKLPGHGPLLVDLQGVQGAGGIAAGRRREAGVVRRQSRREGVGEVVGVQRCDRE